MLPANFVLTSMALATASVILYVRRRVRIIRLDSFYERLLWTFRSWRAGYPVPLDLDQWSLTDPANGDLYFKESRVALRAWKFLEPFFAARGYILYHNQPGAGVFCLLPNPAGPKGHPSPSYPYASRVYKDDAEVEFSFGSLSAWPARDSEGREVVLKMVSGRTPSNELKVLQRLNTPKARADPRNHTIHALDYVIFDGMVFVVMPRWPQAFRHDFGKVAELFHFTEIIIEAFDFMHENRIAHCDFLEQNTGIDVIADLEATYLEGLRDPSVTRYTIYDFNYSLIYPLETILEDVRDTRFYHWGLRRLHTPTDPSVNPFEVDMAYVGGLLQRYVRHIENLVPEIGPFFDSLTVTSDTGKPLTARQALQRIRDIKAGMSTELLNTAVTTRYWRDGVVQTKLEYPIRLPRR
ncbi:hypothetical protein Hypma_005798 [Hypsizygus marmoreus]|uniref:Protein kinase domain-containing protein n=1 Tax=Hypsizygus marmoreus TaxID=39966 RepID=A0A369KD66_HYPMA|nr:hypothetical protein Hypma_005798 [Hypsizygus marmoreus]